MKLIADRSKCDASLPKVYTLSTHFYEKIKLAGVDAVASWTKHVDLFTYDIILIPLHLPGHWTLIVVKVSKKRLVYYDSLLGNGDEQCAKIKAFLQAEAVRRERKELDPMNWMVFNDKNAPKQDNSFDCGVFICRYAESIARGVRPNFEEAQLEDVRKIMVDEILNRELV